MSEDAPINAGRGSAETRDERFTKCTVLYVAPWDLWHPGGVNQVVANLFDTCYEVLGMRPILVVKSWAHRRPHTENVNGRLTIRARFRSPLSGRRPLANLLLYFLTLPRLFWHWALVLRSERVRVVNVHYPDLDSLSWLLLCRLTKTRVVLSFHGTDLHQVRSAQPLAARGWRFILRHADRVVVCSDSLVPKLRDLGCSPERISVIRNGVAPSTIERHALRPVPVQLPPRYVATLATFESKKGLDVLLRAFDMVAAEDTSLHLVLAGRIQDPILFQELLAIRASLASAARIVLLTNLEHDAAIAVLAGALNLVVPSRAEPFGIVVLEAGVLRRPVIATAACGVVQYLRPADEVVVVPTNDHNALAIAIKGLLADPESARRMAERLRTRVLAEFTWRHVAKDYAAAFGLTAPATYRPTRSARP